MLLWPFNLIYQNIGGIWFFLSLVVMILFEFLPTSFKIKAYSITDYEILQRLLPFFFSMILALAAKGAPVIINIAFMLKETDFKEAFRIFWYDGLFGSIILIAYFFVAGIILWFVNYLFNLIINFLSFLSPDIKTFFVEKASTVIYILYIAQILVAFKITNWASESTENFDAEKLVNQTLNRN